MDQLKAQAPHLVLCAIGVAAMLVLALGHEISGDTAFGAIFGITGLGVGGALGLQSSSGTPATPAVTVPLTVTAKSSPSPSPSTPTSSPTSVVAPPTHPAADSTSETTLSPSLTT